MSKVKRLRLVPSLVASEGERGEDKDLQRLCRSAMMIVIPQLGSALQFLARRGR